MKSFSIIIPNYNCGKYIVNALDSIVNNNYNHSYLDVIIIDDGSTDDSIEIIKSYIAKYSFIRLVEKSNGNWGSVVNYAKNNKLTKNEIISILDADDVLTKNCFNTVNKYMKDADLFFGAYTLWNGKRNLIKIFPFYYLFRRSTFDKNRMKTPVPIPLVVFSKTEVFHKTKDLVEGVSYQDLHLLSQLIINTKHCRWTCKVTGNYFFNRPNNSMSETKSMKALESGLISCYKCLEDDNQEFAAYKLDQPSIVRAMKLKKIKFTIHRKFIFKWLPWYLNFAYCIYHKIVHTKYFKMEKN